MSKGSTVLALRAVPLLAFTACALALTPALATQLAGGPGDAPHHLAGAAVVGAAALAWWGRSRFPRCTCTSLAIGLTVHAAGWVAAVAADGRLEALSTALWLTAYPFIGVAILRNARRDASPGGWRPISLDGALVALALLVCAWSIVVEPSLGTPLVAVFLLADLVLVALLVAAVLSSRAEISLEQRMIGIGLLAWLTGDVIHALGPWTPPAGTHPGWALGALLMATAPWSRDDTSRHLPRTLSSAAALVALVPLTLAITGPPSPVEIALTAAAAGGLVVRLRHVARDAQSLQGLVDAQGRSLEQSERRYRTLVEAVSDGIVLTGDDGVIQFANRRMAELLGLPVEDVTGHRLSDFFADDHAPLPSGGRRLQRPDGEEVWVLSASTPLPCAEGAPCGTVTTVTDITDHKRARDAVRRHQQLLETSERVARIGSWEMDMRTGRTNWSAELYRLARKDPASFTPTPRSALGVIHPDDVPRVTGALQDVVHGVVRGSVEFRLCDGGETRTMLGYAERVLDSDGSSRLIGTVRDISAQRAAEQAVQASEERYRSIVETAAEGVWVLDDQGRTTFANRRMADLLGLDPGALEGRPLGDFAEAGEVPALLEGARRGFTAWDVALRRADGETVWALASASPLPGAAGGPGGALLMVADITERVEAERENERLQAVVSQMQKLESVGQLAGGIAHDFNNVLAAIRNNAEFAINELDGHPARHDLLEICRAADRARALTRQLLVFSRQDTIRPEAVDVNAVVAEVRALLRRSLTEDIVLDERLWPGACTVRADAGQLEQVVLNLVVNARDAMPDGGRLTITTEPVDLDAGDSVLDPGCPAGRHVRLVVRDTGCGMPDEVAARALDPFFTTKPKGVGTGLGLATVHGVVSRAGGSLRLRTSPGEGTEVVVHLPAVCEAPARPSVHQPGAPLPAPAGGGRTILLVEDDDQVREVCRRVLVMRGHRVIDHPDGLRALRGCGDAPIDLLLTDVVMPGMSGPSLAARLRERLPDLAVVYMSGYADRPDLPHDTEGFLPKPFDPSGLVAHVERALDRRVAEGAPAS